MRDVSNIDEIVPEYKSMNSIYERLDNLLHDGWQVFRGITFCSA